MDTGFLAAILVAAVLVYDRLGGNRELSRRLFQVGLAVSLVFLVVSGAVAFIRADEVQGGFSTATSNSAYTDAANRMVAVTAVQYGFGVGFLIVGLATLRRYHTVPIAFVVSGVFLVLNGPAWGNSTVLSMLSRLNAQSTQKFDVGVFGVAVGGTIALLAYGMQLESEFASDVDAEGDGAGSEPGEGPV